MPSRTAEKAPPKPPPDQYLVTAGFVAVLDGELDHWAPAIGTVWPSAHPGVRHMLANGGLNKFLVPVDQADEPTIRGARAAAETFPMPPEPEPKAEGIPPERIYRATRFVIHAGVQMASPGQLFDSQSPLGAAILALYPDAFQPAPEEAHDGYR